MTFKGFNDSKRLLDRSQYFDMLEGKKISALLPRSWKKSFDKGIILPKKMIRCHECKVKYYVTSVIFKLTKTKNSKLTQSY